LKIARINRRGLGLLVLAVVSVSLLTFGLYEFLYYTRTSQEDNYEAWSYGWNTQERQYDGVSSAGTFVQVLDQGSSGYALVGTAANGSLLLIRTRSQITRGVLWEKTYGSGSGNAIVQTSDLGFAIAGTKISGTGADSENSSWLVKTDPEGAVQWSKVYEGSGFSAVVNASDGGYALLTRLSVNGAEYPVLLKVDAAGNVQWKKQYSRSEAETLMLHTLISISDDGYAMVGDISYTISGVAMRNGWFVKTDANGEAQVNRPFSLNGWCVLRSVAQTGDGGFLLVGGTAESADGDYAACIICTDWDGHMRWSRTKATLGDMGGAGGFEYYSAAKMKNGSFIVVGYLTGAGATVELVNSSGDIELYEVRADVAEVNYVIPLVETIPENQSGYAFAGYRSGAMWLVEKKPYIRVAVP
jgi:hypothetical protein